MAVETLIGIDEVFWNRVTKTPGCWIWTGYIGKGGYGFLTVDSKSYTAHRYSWQLYNGPIPFGFCILHSCDNPPCVNPDHLFLGTHQDNSTDMMEKGRNYRQGMHRPGGRRSGHKLIKPWVEVVKFGLRHGESGASLGRRFGVSRQMINLIKLGKNWKGG